MELNIEHQELIVRIADRAVDLFRKAHGSVMKGAALAICMDLGALHRSGQPVDLLRLFRADDLNFSHDVFGINSSLDRETYRLKNFFVPRYSIGRSWKCVCGYAPEMGTRLQFDKQESWARKCYAGHVCSAIQQHLAVEEKKAAVL